MTATMTFPPHMLMRVSKKFKLKEDRVYLKRRLELWEKREIRQMSEEAEALPRRLSTNTPPPKYQLQQDLEIACGKERLRMPSAYLIATPTQRSP